jgi:hypothetical protein
MHMYMYMRDDVSTRKYVYGRLQDDYDGLRNG